MPFLGLTDIRLQWGLCLSRDEYGDSDCYLGAWAIQMYLEKGERENQLDLGLFVLGGLPSLQDLGVEFRPR